MKYLLIFLAIFSASIFAQGTKDIEDLGFEYQFRVGTKQERYAGSLVYQHKRSGNCYTWRVGIRGGTLTPVHCADFGLDPEEQLQARKEEHAQKIRMAREAYEKLLETEVK